MFVWFVTMAVLGVLNIDRQPLVLTAFNPPSGLAFFVHNSWINFAVLGAVFLVVTGGEALYTDHGHFGRLPSVSPGSVSFYPRSKNRRTARELP